MLNITPHMFFSNAPLLYNPARDKAHDREIDLNLSFLQLNLTQNH